MILMTPLAFAQDSLGADEDVFAILDNALSPDFGYDDNNQPTVETFDDFSITISSPVLKDSFDQNITQYEVQYATASYIDLQTTDQLDSIIKKDFVFSAEELQGQTTINMPLFIGEDFEASSTYYVTLYPYNSDGLFGDNSEEFTFNLNDLLIEQIAQQEIEANDNLLIQEELSEQENDTTDEIENIHNAAPDMCAANISYTQEDNKITITWTAIDTGMAQFDIRHTSEADFRTVTSVSIPDETYTFYPSQDGTHFLRITPLDDNGNKEGTECIQTINIEPFTVSAVNTNTGPTETALIIAIIIAAMGYIAWRRKQIA